MINNPRQDIVSYQVQSKSEARGIVKLGLAALPLEV